MKKLLFGFIIASVLGTAVYADHPSKLGIGGVIGGGYGGYGAGGDLGLSLKLTSMPIFWAFNVSLNSSGVGLRATGDYYFIDTDFITEKGFNLDWYFGAGGYVNIAVGGGLGLAVGGRAPIGLSWHITNDIEFWLAAAPSLGLGIVPLKFPDWSLPAEIGLRFWLK